MQTYIASPSEATCLRLNIFLCRSYRARTAAAALPLLFGGATCLSAQTTLPDAPSATAVALQLSMAEPVQTPGEQASSSSQQAPVQQDDRHGDAAPQKPILQQQKRIFGVLPNYTSVSGGTTPPPAGWRTDSRVAFKQSTDYVGNLYSIATSAIAYAQDSHPLVDTVNGGNAPLWGYVWRGLVDKTSQTAQGSLLFPALLHQDTRYFALGRGSKVRRTVHAAAAVVVAHSYSGRPVFNVAGLAGKVGAQALSTTYYPTGSENFGVLAEKFTYACLRQAGFTILREFSPDIAQHLHRHHDQP